MLFVEFARLTDGFRIKYLHKWIAYRLCTKWLKWKRKDILSVLHCCRVGEHLALRLLTFMMGLFPQQKDCHLHPLQHFNPNLSPAFQAPACATVENTSYSLTWSPPIQGYWCDNKSQACWARDSWLSWLVSSTTMTKPTQSSSTWTNNWAQVVLRHWRFTSAHPGQHDEHVQYISKYHRGWHKSGCKQEPYQKKTLKINKHHKMNQLSGLTTDKSSNFHRRDDMRRDSITEIQAIRTLMSFLPAWTQKKIRFSSKGPFLFSWELSVFVITEETSPPKWSAAPWGRLKFSPARRGACGPPGGDPDLRCCTPLHPKDPT